MAFIGFFLGFIDNAGGNDKFIYAIENKNICKPLLSKTETRPVEKKKTIPEIVVKYSELYDIDPNLIHAVMKKESGKDHSKVSPKGAIGLMQLMPNTARHLGVNPHSIEDNIRGGIMYLAEQIKTFGNTRLALAAYNAGPGNVYKYDMKVPPFRETIKYVNSICSEYACS